MSTGMQSVSGANTAPDLSLRKGGRRARDRTWMLLTYLTLAVFVLWTLIPFGWMILTSVKTSKEIYREFTFIPEQIYWGHYQELFEGKFMIWMRNSTYVALATTGISMVLGSLAAYALTRLKFQGRRVAARGLVLTYMVPTSLLFIPLFKTVVNLNLSDTLTSLILVYPTFALPFCTWMLMSYFQSIPGELEEAALIDGCSRLGVLFRILIPLSLPAMAVVALFAFTQAWNEFLYALVFTTSQSTRTVTVGLTQMQAEDVFFWGKMMAGAVIASLPPVLMYMLGQRLVIQGLTRGSIKG